MAGMGQRIATVADRENAGDDARLIAAAPALVQSLEDLADCADQLLHSGRYRGDDAMILRQEIDEARAAIAKIHELIGAGGE